jgi:hypothetical protein
MHAAPAGAHIPQLALQQYWPAAQVALPQATCVDPVPGPPLPAPAAVESLPIALAGGSTAEDAGGVGARLAQETISAKPTMKYQVKRDAAIRVP